jgi:hypothetical protein
MSVYEYIDPTSDEMARLFWSLAPVVAGQAKITEPDVFRLMQRAWLDKLKALKPHHAIDYGGDGRTALWRVRLMIWRIGPEGQEDLFADSDDGARFAQHGTAPGSTVLSGLPTVAGWVRELCTGAHPGATLDGLDEHVLANKIKSLRVALSNSGGNSIWRVRYTVTPPAAEPSSNPLKSLSTPPQRFLASVHVQREESARGSKS